MDVKEFGGALFNEYFINETHAILILESCYGGPTNWSSIQWTKDESATNNNSTDTGPDVFADLFGDSSPVASDPRTEVLGMTIFWILLPLCLACVYHPLASSIHNHSRFRLYFHVSPLFCCLDVIFMAIQCCVIGEKHPLSWRRVVEVVVNHRLKAFLSPPYTHGQSIEMERGSLPAVEGGSSSASTPREEPEHREPSVGSSSTTNTTIDLSSDPTVNQLQFSPGLPVPRAPSDVLAHAALNLYVRLIAGALNIILYAKICGFSGIRPWSVVADCIFNCWLIMEFFLFLGYYAAPRSRRDASDESAYSATLAVESSDLTPATEASALTPLFVEISVSLFAIYYATGPGITIGTFCLHTGEWYMGQPSKYLVEIPFGLALSLSHPLFIPGLLCAIALLAVWIFVFTLLSVLAILSFIAPPVCYSLVSAVIFGACKRLAQRYHRTFRISDSTLNIACARVLVAIVCTHYIVFFLWFYDSQGTKKASWTELLSRRLR